MQITRYCLRGETVSSLENKRACEALFNTDVERANGNKANNNVSIVTVAVVVVVVVVEASSAVVAVSVAAVAL